MTLRRTAQFERRIVDCGAVTGIYRSRRYEHRRTRLGQFQRNARATAETA
jgi:hypothetical protein